MSPIDDSPDPRRSKHSIALSLIAAFLVAVIITVARY
jgi:hypothetical protein